MWEIIRTFVPASENKMEEQKKQKAGRALAIVIAAAAVIALVAVIARQPGNNEGIVFEKTSQVIDDEACGFTVTLPAGYARVTTREADSTRFSQATYYALGRDNDITIQCFPAFFSDSTDVDHTDIRVLDGLDEIYYRKGRWGDATAFDLGPVHAVRSIGPHPTLENAVNISYDIRNGEALITMNFIYYTKDTPRRPDWDKVRAANDLVGTVQLR